MNHNTLRVSLGTTSKLENVDPARVDTLLQAHFVRMLFGRLVEYAPDGQLVAALAETFHINNGVITFKIRDTAQTVDGLKITAEDAALSLKRQVILGTNTHGDLKSFLCSGSNIKSINDSCPGITTDGNLLKLKVSNEKRAKFLIPLLASVDFSILPKNIVNWKSKKLEITEYRNTSGPYYIETNDSKGEHKFSINRAFYFYSSKMAETIEVVPSIQDESIERFKNGDIDLISTVDQAQRFKIETLAIETPNAVLHHTMPIISWRLAFTRRGFKNLTIEQRRFIGKIIRGTKLLSLLGNRVTSNIAFLPTLGEGGLTLDQLQQVEKTIADTLEPTFAKKVVISVGERRKTDLENLLREYSKFFTIKVVRNYPWLLPESEQPDIYITDGDTAFFESISLLSYHFDHGTFGLSREEGIKWLENYMDIEDKAERLKLLQKLHYDSLINATVIPLGIESAVALARKPWKIGFSKFFIGSPLWQVTSD